MSICISDTYSVSTDIIGKTISFFIKLIGIEILPILWFAPPLQPIQEFGREAYIPSINKKY